MLQKLMAQPSDVITKFESHPVLTEVRDQSEETEKQYELVPIRTIDSGPSLPMEFDGKTQWGPLVTPVQDQGRCGSCWVTSFATPGCE
jgi:C1A family cysteine protease